MQNSHSEQLYQSGQLVLKGPRHRPSSHRASGNTDKMEIYHLKYQDSELGYTYQRWPDKKSVLKAAIRVGKTRESILLGTYILPFPPTLATALDTSAEAKSFQAMAEGKQAKAHSNDGRFH